MSSTHSTLCDAPELCENYKDMNCTELEGEYFDRFGHTAEGAPKESIMEALEDGIPLEDYLDPVHVMRNQISEMVAEHWENIQMQLKCGGTCYKCNKGTVVDCWLVNREHLNEGEAKMSKANVNIEMTIEELEEAGIFEDRNAMIRYLTTAIKRDGGDSKDIMALIQKKPAELADLVRQKASDAPDVGDEGEEEEEEEMEETTEAEEKPKKKKGKGKGKGRGRPKGSKNKKSKGKKKSKKKAQEDDEDKGDVEDTSSGDTSCDLGPVNARLDNIEKAIANLGSTIGEGLADVKGQAEKNWKGLEAFTDYLNSIHESLAIMLEYSLRAQMGDDMVDALAEADENFPFGESEEEDED